MEKFDLYFYEKHYEKGLCRVVNDSDVVLMYEKKDAYVIQSEPINKTDMVCSMKTFYADSLSLMTEGKYLKNGGTEIGEWKTYNNFGELIDLIDYEEGWNSHWEDILKLMGDNNIDLNQIINISRYIDEPEGIKENGGHYWSITILSKSGMNYIEYVFDSDRRKKVYERHQKIN